MKTQSRWTLFLFFVVVWNASAQDWREALNQAEGMTLARDASGAVDGVINGETGFHTDCDPNPWWRVDLGKNTRLFKVLVYNRNHIPERAKTLSLSLSLDGEKWKKVYQHPGTLFFGYKDNKPLVIPLKGKEARYVRLELNEKTWFHLDEVQIFGESNPKENIALHKPALQSSLSQWSTPPTKKDFVDYSNLKNGKKIIESLLSPCKGAGLTLRSELNRILKKRIPMDQAAWRLLYDSAKKLKNRVISILNQWPYLSNTWKKGLDPLSNLDLAEELLQKRKAAYAKDMEILFVRRPLNTPRLGLPNNFNGNENLPRIGYDDALELVHSNGDRELLIPPQGNFIGDVQLHFDREKLLYSTINSKQRWRVNEFDIKNLSAREIGQIQAPDVDNYDACYTGDGDIIFSSTATFIGVPCVYGSSHVANLYRLYRKTGEIRRLTFDQEHNWCPTLMEDGRILYLRWEYADLPHSNSRLLFTMNPDGTNQMELYGSNCYFPNSLFYAQNIHGNPTRLIGVATGHHGTSRSGRLLLLDAIKGRMEAQGVFMEIPGGGKKVSTLVRDRLVDGVWPQFLHPHPVTDRLFLVSAKLSPDGLWGLYLADLENNLVLLEEQEGFALLEPTLFIQRKKPPVLPHRINREDKQATVFMSNVYAGQGLAGIPKGVVKKLRLFTYYFSSRGMGGLLGSIGMDGPWDIRRVMGEVPVAPDGSACFKVPANRPIAIQPLDAEGKALQQMRSWFTAMPGEVLSCVGCHESRNESANNARAQALSRIPSKIKPWYGPERGFSFMREVQPVLDAHCIRCHTSQSHLDLTGDQMITDWSSQISGNAGAHQGGGKFSVSYANLHAFVRRPGIESDMHLLKPMDFHADTTELVQILQKGHHNVHLDQESWDRVITWIDMNAPYHGTWTEIIGQEKTASITNRRREFEKKYGGVDVDYEAVYPAAQIKPGALAAPERSVAKTDIKPIFQENTLKEIQLPMGNGDPLLLKPMPAGCFIMGDELEAPPCGVTIKEPFWISACEITNEQFQLFDPSHDSGEESRRGYQFGRTGYPLNRAKQPVVRITWFQAMAFCDWLSKKTGLRVSLPTEAQWEYACRAGTATPFSYGDKDTDFSPWANLGDFSLKEYAACTAHEFYASARVLENPNQYDDWTPKDERFNDHSFLSAKVGSYAPNPWGLYDMHGNVWEWTRSNLAPYPYVSGDGRENLSKTARKMVRGGSWYDRPKRCSSAYRLSYQPYHGVFNVGFRVVVE